IAQSVQLHYQRQQHLDLLRSSPSQASLAINTSGVFMSNPPSAIPPSTWLTGTQAWDQFVATHPELGLKSGRWAFHNFLRFHRQTLIDADAIRKARKRFWIANPQRMFPLAFDFLTGHDPGKLSAPKTSSVATNDHQF
ncbi:MAG: hypothetical protein EB069_10585, partial [Actinobacteria bacterium]|nr:hypothetical protein [Actinomycetota bacterium]